MSSTDTSKLAKLRRAAAWIRDTGLGTFGVVLLAVVTTAGWGASTLGLQDFAITHMAYYGWKSWLVPIAFDGAAIGLSISAFRAAINGRSALFSRIGIFAFTGLSSWMNYAHIVDPTGRKIAALLPVSAVVLMESLLSEARRAHETRTGKARPRIHVLRWVFDRAGTLGIMRAYVLGLPLPDQLADAQVKVTEEQAAAEAEAEAKTAARRKKPRPPQQPAVDVEPVTEVIPVVSAELADTGQHARSAEVIELDQEDRPGWLTESMTAKDAMLRYLDDHPQVSGAELTRLALRWGFDVNGDYGRTIRGQWKKALEGQREAVGE